PASGIYWSPWFRWNTTLYVGIVPLFFALAAIRTPRRGWAAFFGAIVVVGLWLALGASAPLNLFDVVRSLPILSSTRVPSRFLFFVVFGLAVLAGLGLDALVGLLARGAGRRMACLLAAAALLPVALVAAAHRWVPGQRPLVEQYLLQPYARQAGGNITLTHVGDTFQALLGSLDPATGWTARTLVALCATALLVVGLALLPRARAALQVALLLVAAADLVLFGRDFHPRLPFAGVLAGGPAVDFLAAHNGLHRVATSFDVWETAPNRLVPNRIADANGYSSLLPDRHRAYMAAAMRLDNRLLDLMGVRYLVQRRANVPARLQSERPVFQDSEVAIFERPTALPRALVVGMASYATDPTAALDAMTRPGFDPTRLAVVEDRAARGADLPCRLPLPRRAAAARRPHHPLRVPAVHRRSRRRRQPGDARARAGRTRLHVRLGAAAELARGRRRARVEGHPAGRRVTEGGTGPARRWPLRLAGLGVLVALAAAAGLLADRGAVVSGADGPMAAEWVPLGELEWDEATTGWLGVANQHLPRKDLSFDAKPLS